MTSPSTSNSAPALPLLPEGELIRLALTDEYDILEELGRGGMAVVFHARERALDRDVAIKVLPGRLMIDQGFVERFEHEARTAAKLEHPNIVPIHRVGRAGPNGEVIYFVMKLLRGRSLSAVLKERGTLEAGELRHVLLDTASALQYAAKRGVVHRDIKPDNIMLDSDGRCVITDFGIAKSPGGQQTAAGTSMGTPQYMSPEHASGATLDGRSDMYSLGIVAYECLVGKTPFVAEDPFAILYKHIHDPLPQPTLKSDEERELYTIIARMLAKRPDERYQTGDELVAALGGKVSVPTLVPAQRTSMGLFAPTQQMTTPMPWGGPKWRSRSKREQRALIAAGVGLVAAAVGLGLSFRGPSGGKAGAQGAAVPVQKVAAAPTPSTPAPRRDSATVVQASKAVRPAGPSDRAAAILAYNRLKGSCPKRDTMPNSKAIAYELLVDSVKDRVVSDKMDVGYDVCGLSKGEPYRTVLTLTKIHQRLLGKQPPHEEAGIANASSPRTHRKWTLDTHEMSAGDYQLDVLVTDQNKRQATATRFFKINDKPTSK